ncbi:MULTISPECIES: phage tail protein [Bacillus cereus group]|uniref:phage tail protein n=1 Tax=Bacillus cereus group TaxID=86661 RepID=UPI0018CD7059|nr:MULTISPECIES: phage tail protein [Bacillus cereus group]MBG9841777.1 tail protein [Bacillus tropicus]MBG9879075.1 tail protein [Bacillus tropicus]MBG9923198.1 tail protein [Bacillus tropicus]MBJ8356171.1 phage tail protein [Bacillus mycoides]MED2903816.1 phage tail protein [Bacillus tropicus]
MAKTVIEEFDSMSFTNVGIQFIEGGIQQPGTKFGCVGTIEGETEMLEKVKKCEGVEVKKMSKPIKMNMTLSGHLRVDVIRKVFGIKADGLKAGVWSYGTKSKGKAFVLTADVIDEFSDVKKMVAFSNCTSTTGFKFKVENGADELAETELEFTALKDSNDDFYYEALVDEVDDAQVKEKWHTQFTPELVKL